MNLPSTPQTSQLQGSEQQLHGGPVDGLRHLPVHRLRRRGAPHLLRPQHLPPDGDYGGTVARCFRPHAQITCHFWLCLTVALAGGGLHGAGGGGGRQEAGADEGRETCSQLHDGLPHLQEGSEKYQQYFNKIWPEPGKKRWRCHWILIYQNTKIEDDVCLVIPAFAFGKT